MLLISKSVRALLPYWYGPLGQLFTPRLLAGKRYDLKLWTGALHESATYPPA
jgi:hypothetical protein